MTDEPVERRRTVRVYIRIEVRLEVLLPEESSPSVSLTGRAREISTSGVRIETADTPRDLYQMVVRQARSVRICGTLPGSKREMSFPGKVVWVQRNEEIKPPITAFGIMFENLGAREKEALEACVGLLMAGLALGGVEDTRGGKRRPPGPI